MKKYSILTFLTLFFSFGAAFSQTHKPTFGNNKAAGKFYDVNGIKLYAETYGAGKPLLMLHGNGGNIGAFSKNIAFFAKHFKVIAVDSRAQGKSVDTGSALTFEMIADDFAELMNQMKIDSAYVIGWSDGGIDALVLAMRHPEKVKKLAATGANMWLGENVFLPGVWAGFTKEYLAKKDSIFTDPKAKNDFKVFALDYLEPNYKPTDLAKVNCPSLIIAGDKDLITLEHTLELFKNIPKAQLWILPNTGHGTLIERSYDFNQQVYKFFKDK